MTSESRVLLGEIVGAVGIRGQVSIRSYCESPESISNYGLLSTECGSSISLECVRTTSKRHLVANVSGVSSRQQAEGLRGALLFAEKENLPDLDEDEYYIADLQGLQALDERGSPIGRIVGAHNFGAGDVIDIALADSGESILVPFNRDIFVSVEIAGGRVVVDLPDGIL
ncbi:MAG: ribosome maturation factor RimM [Albidovulum sp.]|nr:ribosome maturation factor RimM [Albidovulum sp.]